MPCLIREISASLSLFGRAHKIQFLWPQPLWSHDIFYLAGRRQEESCHLLARLEWVRTAWEHTVTEYTLCFYKPVCVCDWFAVLLHVMLCCFTINMSSCCQWRNITNYIYFNSNCCSVKFWDNCSLHDYFHFLLLYNDHNYHGFTFSAVGGSADWLVVWLVSRLVGWLVSCLVG